MRYLIDNTLKTNDRLRFSVDRAGSLNETVKSFCAFLLNKGKLVSIQVFSEVNSIEYGSDVFKYLSKWFRVRSSFFDLFYIEEYLKSSIFLISV